MSNKINSSDIKKLREITGARILDCKKALEQANGDLKKAQKFVEEKCLARAEKSADRETKVGYIASYVHTTGMTASMVEILCETDFVAKNEDFRKMANNIAMQVVAMNPKDVNELLSQDYIRDPEITVDTLVKKLSGKIGEKMVINKIVRFEVGEE